MSLSLEEVRHIARLARIELAEGEDIATQDKLNSIFGLIEQIQAVDTEGIEPMSHPQELAQRLRPDEAREGDRRAEASDARRHHAGGDVVPGVSRPDVRPRRRLPRAGTGGGVSTGGCACGAVRYRVDGPLRPVVMCHCETCRRTSGHFAAATAAPRGAVVIEGEVRWYRSSASGRRGFCPACGSQLFWDGAPERLSIFAGTLDLPTGLTAAGHIFCAEQGDYYAIADGLPQAPGPDADLTRLPL
jgi:aspartyl/glutamyl-tRNA(Asn/Gln) amidotransferase C subunit